jgi:MraZ protein
MFRGSHTAKVDDKSRLKLPSEYKLLVDAGCISHFYITSDNGQSAQIWPLPEWEKREAILAPHSMDEAVERYQELTGYYGQQVQIDQQGRLLLPQILRNAAGLEEDVVVLGKATYLEVFNRERFEARLKERELTSEHRQTLAAILNPKPAVAA